NLDVFCLGPASWPDKENLAAAPAGIPLPRDILRGVHKGVEDGGNRSGIPTVTGAFYFDEDYIGRPLVYCGTVGVLPRNKSSLVKKALAGHRIVMIGGAIGADGIHGATFSSMQLDENAPATAVQIGNPLMQKRMQDLLLEARDKNLYSSVTDNGAGGLSSSVGEMALQTGGACLDLSLCPVKYPGLKPFELMISESQERMTLAVAPDKMEEFLSLASQRGVDATDLGSFNESGYLTVKYKDATVGELSLNFLHEPPPLKLKAHYQGPQKRAEWGFIRRKKDFNREKEKEGFYKDTLYSLLRSPTVASKEAWTRRYDHQVQAATHLSPFVGLGDGPGNAAVIWAYPHGGEKENAFGLGCGLAPEASLFDPYTMAQYAVDEAIRNVVVVGGDLDYCCLLDNFSWPDPVLTTQNPQGAHKLGQLVRACRGLYDICVAYGTPLVSGKDSMKNSFSGKNRKGDPLYIDILPTLLVTAMAKTSIMHTCSSDLKKAGDVLYLLGKNGKGLAASRFSQHIYMEEQKLPPIDLSLNKKIYRLYNQGLKRKLISMGHDLSEGGLLIALVESMIGGRLGARIDLPCDYRQNALDISEFLFGESPGRFLVGVDKQKAILFEEHFKDVPLIKLGEVTTETIMEVWSEDRLLMKSALDSLDKAWRGSC
ncbi:MAG: AIR synthase-related protein, partial [Halobacteriovoraceae bacterium]|nr:AIR synthase-related protein [Halobacteriovoraceae bacterium]